MHALSLAIVSFALTVAAVTILMRSAARLNLLDRPDQRKLHNGAIPMVGGLALYCVLMLMLLSGAVTVPSTAPLMVVATIVTLVGAIDDRKTINPRWRLLMQLIVALLVVYDADLRLDHLGSISLSGERFNLGPFSVAVTVFGVICVINAMNFIDGLDGLAGGLALIAVVGLWVVFASNSREIPDLLPVLTGGLLAFLLYNARWFGRKKASLFLGDAGSTLLGLMLAWLMVDYSQGESAAMSPVIALYLLAIPLFDLLATFIRRMMKGRSPLHADREHLHHIIIHAGRSDKATVMVIHIAAVSLAVFGTLGHAYHWPQNIMYYSFVALFLAFYYTKARLASTMQIAAKVFEPKSVGRFETKTDIASQKMRRTHKQNNVT